MSAVIVSVCLTRLIRMPSSRPRKNRTHPLLLSDEISSVFCLGNATLEGTTVRSFSFPFLLCLLLTGFFQRERVATIRMLDSPSKLLGFVKLTNRNELGALDTIQKSGSKLLLNRVILPVKVAEISGHAVAFLPYGGDPLQYSWRKARRAI